MITDPIFYRLFETAPETFFIVLGLTAESARDMASRYQYEALEFKETSHRTDGVFCPKEPGLPLYFLEVQFYPLPSVYADLLAKAYTYLKQHDPGQPFFGVVLFATRALEPKELTPYRVLLDAEIIRPIYVDELPAQEDASLGMSILKLIPQTEGQAPETARRLIVRARQEIHNESLRANLVELIETIVVYKLPRLSRQEIQTMLQVHDIRETKVYQEAKEEGIQEGIEKGIEKGIEEERRRTILRMAELKMSPGRIAKILGVDLEVIQQELARG